MVGTASVATALGIGVSSKSRVLSCCKEYHLQKNHFAHQFSGPSPGKTDARLLLLFCHEASAKWRYRPLGREQARPADRPAIKINVIAAFTAIIPYSGQSVKLEE